MGDRNELGRRGEQAAADFLAGLGWTVVARNWRCREGEIDIIARDGPTLVFCEVKTRRGTGFGVPFDAITHTKRVRLRRLVAAYLAEAAGHPGPVRIDAIGILWARGGSAQVEHLRGVAQ